MPRPKFPQPYRHDHGPIINVNEVICEQLTFGQGEPAAHRRASNLAIVRVPTYQGSISIIMQEVEGEPRRL